MESSLYAPVKRHFEALGYTVKGEIGPCDLVALREGEPPIVVIAELKMSFTLDLVLQGVDRAAMGDEVWLAVALSRRGRGREGDSRVRKLCRRLGFGLMTVAAAGRVDILVEPGPYRPRMDGKRRSRLVREHERRRGDPTVGGSTRSPVMTAYRQRALICAAALRRGPARPAELRAACPEAGSILSGNVYGWFERVKRGVYGLTPAGHDALARWAADLPPVEDPETPPSLAPPPVETRVRRRSARSGSPPA